MALNVCFQDDIGFTCRPFLFNESIPIQVVRAESNGVGWDGVG